jgi:hypothetical protein
MKLLLMTAVFVSAILICYGLQTTVSRTSIKPLLKELLIALVGIAAIIFLVLTFAFVFGDKNDRALPDRITYREYIQSHEDPEDIGHDQNQECWDKQGNYEC